MSKILVILGPTSTGKTDLALSLAKKFNGELVACDSRQVYKGLDIGTGKNPSQLKIENCKLKIERGNGWWQVNGGRTCMYDVVDPKKQYTVYDYVKDATRVVGEIRERGKLPIIVGGTGLYLRALIDGLPNLAFPIDLKLRKELKKLSLEQLQKKLQKIAFERWEKMNNSDRQNPRRLIRAIEIASTDFTSEESLPPPPELRRTGRATVRGGLKTLKIGLTAPRNILYKRIDERVVSRIKQGMIDEAKRLHETGLTFKRMRQLGLEYGVLADYLEGKIKSREELIKQLQGKIHGYARRQLTWFKNPSTSSGYIQWFDITDRNYPAKVENLIAKWYDTPITYASKN